jgi:hypothetical protein
MAKIEAPTIEAYREGVHLVFWCEHEKKWHYHGVHDGSNPRCIVSRRGYARSGDACTCPKGSGDGHRCSHCSCDRSPYRDSGYYLKEVGTMTKEVKRQHRSTRAIQCPQPECRAARRKR